MSSVLVKSEIIQKKLILTEDEFEEEKCYKPASYDLRLGADYFSPSKSQKENDDSCFKIKSCENKVLRIPPYSSIIVSSFEKVNLPNNIVGRFDLRVKWALRGLIFQNGTQVEPGYKGRLFGLILNLSDTTQSIQYCDYDDRIFTIEFKYTSEPAKVKKNKKEPTLKDFLKTPIIVGGLDKFLETSKIVTDKAKEASEAALKSRMGRWEVWASAILLLITLAISVILPITVTNAIDENKAYMKNIKQETSVDPSITYKYKNLIILDEISKYKKIEDDLISDKKNKKLINFINNKIQELKSKLK